MKYVTLIFSDRRGPPSKDFKPVGYGGFCHNEQGYLQPLLVIAELLNREALFPEPWMSLYKGHNNGKLINKNNTWQKYLNLDNVKHLHKNPPFTFMKVKPPFTFSENGDINLNNTGLSIGYYPSNIPLQYINPKNDIVVLVNYENVDDNLHLGSYLRYNKNNLNYSKYRFQISNTLKNHTQQIINELKLENYIFIHIRRRDALNIKQWCPPDGTKGCTSPDFISNFVKNELKNNENQIQLKNKTIIIATDEEDINYKIQLKSKITDHNLIFEEDIIQKLPEDIKNDNICIYLIMHEFARRAKINVGTIIKGYVRLGYTYHYRLGNYVNNNWTKTKE